MTIDKLASGYKKMTLAKMTSDKLASGYSSNRQHWDGTSWATEKN
jgi:hypothetical protein